MFQLVQKCPETLTDAQQRQFEAYLPPVNSEIRVYCSDCSLKYIYTITHTRFLNCTGMFNDLLNCVMIRNKSRYFVNVNAGSGILTEFMVMF